MRTNIILEQGFRPPHRDEVAKCYWQAFARKLALPLGPEAKALEFIGNNLDPTHAISAVSADGAFLGVAGFKTSDGAFVGGDFSALATAYGNVSACWRALLISVLEREFDPGMLLMDGLFVKEQARGWGVGSQLLDAVVQQTKEKGLERVRLDVIDTNSRARSLYERKGFQATDEQRLGMLAPVFGFSSATTMIKTVKSARC